LETYFLYRYLIETPGRYYKGPRRQVADFRDFLGKEIEVDRAPCSRGFFIVNCGVAEDLDCETEMKELTRLNSRIGFHHYRDRFLSPQFSLSPLIHWT